MDRLLDITLTLAHSALILFNLSGWAFRRARRLHLVVISATILSWVGLGLFYGFGYCPLTDWHWEVKRALGEGSLPASWVKYYVDALTGMNWSPRLVDSIVAAAGCGALIASLAVNLKDRPSRRRE